MTTRTARASSHFARRIVVLGALSVTAGVPPTAQEPAGAPVSAHHDFVAAAIGAVSPPVQSAGGFEWVWALSGPVAGEAGSDMAIAADGTIFIAGHNAGIDGDGDGAVDIPADGVDPLFLKVSAEGKLAWIRAPTAPGYNEGSGIAPDGQGGAYATGSFRETLSFGSDRTLRGVGGNEGFLGRYDAGGELVWARALSGDANQSLLDVATDGAGNAVVAGFGGGSFTFEEGGDTFRAAGQATALIASYDPQGNVRWARVGSSSTASYARTLAVAPDGHIVVAGDYSGGSVDLDGDGEQDLPQRPGRSGFLARFSPDGRLAGAWPISGAEGILGTGIAFAGNGDLLLAGTLAAPADFDDDGTPDAEVRSEGRTSAFLARYSPAGSLQWVRSYVTAGAWDVTTDGQRLVLSGFYRGARDLDEDGEVEPHSSDGKRKSDLAILIVSATGQPESVWTAPGPGNDQVRAAAFLPGRPILYVTGFVQLTADFSGDGETDEGWIRCDALGDLIVARYRLVDRTPNDPAPGQTIDGR